MRKPRPQGPLNLLTPEKRAVLHRLLLEPLTQVQMVARIKAELGIVTSASAVSKYYQRHTRELLNVHGGQQAEVTAPGLTITLVPQASGGWRITIRPLTKDQADAETTPE